MGNFKIWVVDRPSGNGNADFHFATHASKETFQECMDEVLKIMHIWSKREMWIVEIKDEITIKVKYKLSWETIV